MGARASRRVRRGAWIQAGGAALPRAVSRWLNVGLGLAYTGVQGTTFFGSAVVYQVVVVLEIFITLAIVAYALRWPRETAATQPLS